MVGAGGGGSSCNPGQGVSPSGMKRAFVWGREQQQQREIGYTQGS